MRNCFVCLFCLASLVMVSNSVEGKAILSPSLQSRLEDAAPQELIRVNVVMKNQADPRELETMVAGKSKEHRRAIVVSELRRLAAQDQAALLSWLRDVESEGRTQAITPLWGINAICLTATRQVIDQIMEYDEVSYLDYDEERHLLLRRAQPFRGVAEPDVTLGGKEIVWNVQRINADQVWPQGYRGQGIVVAVLDTGVNYNHGDLAGQIWTDPNYPNHGWDFYNNDNDPMDGNGHGSHCAGTVASDGTNGSNCGVAPEAQVMALKVLSNTGSGFESDVWQAIDFAIAPPLSPSNGADVMSLSLGWQHQWAPARATWRNYCNNALAAGVVMAVAAGNERGMNSPPDAIRTPGDVPPPWWNPEQDSGGLSAVVTVGATDIGASDPYAWFSSPGPVTWETVIPFNDYSYPPGLIDPDVAAPGAAGGSGIKSIAHNNNTGYTQTIGGWPAEGTSMACPHCAGAMALMLSKNPGILPVVLDSILEVTAVDRGPAGKDNDYGAGRIDVLAAVNAVPGLPQEGGIVYVSHWVDDSGQAWPDSALQPGETVDLIVTLANDSNVTLSNVLAILRTASTFITLNDSMSTYGNMSPGDTVDNSSMPYNLSADPATPQGIDIPCTLFITAFPAYQVEREFMLNIASIPGVEESQEARSQMQEPGLLQNSPNPFCRSTAILYSIGSAVGGQPSAVNLSIYDLAGRLVRTLVDAEQGPGSYSVTWDARDLLGRDVPTGIYLCSLSVYPEQPVLNKVEGRRGASEHIATKKLIVLR